MSVTAPVDFHSVRMLLLYGITWNGTLLVSVPLGAHAGCTCRLHIDRSRARVTSESDKTHAGGESYSVTLDRKLGNIFSEMHMVEMGQEKLFEGGLAVRLPARIRFRSVIAGDQGGVRSSPAARHCFPRSVGRKRDGDPRAKGG